MRECPNPYCDAELDERVTRAREAHAVACYDRDFAMRDRSEQLVHLQLLVKRCGLFNNRAASELQDARAALEIEGVPDS